MQRIFWRPKDGTAAPINARFSLRPFSQPLISLEATVISTLPSPTPKINVLKRIDTPTKAEWIKLVNEALAHIREGHLRKVVLARETILHLDHAPDPFAIAAALSKRSEGAALFCVELGPERAFLGATPERLFRRRGNQLFVEAVAGTRKRSEKRAEDERLRDELLSSEKDIREFRFVQEYFTDLLAQVAFSPIRVHRTANVQHLFSEGVSAVDATENHLDLVERLHPSPALCGTPKQDAFTWINAHEPFARGPYGGIIGWEKDHESEWMVAIRCCLLEGAVAKLYVGTGIVEGSDPHLEWEELEAKMALYRSIFEGL
jgi:menaquinone-specific isochorismate synthase